VAVHALVAGQSTHYDPIVFHGPSGTGKTHLARGIVQAFKAQHNRPAVYATATDFARELNDAFETNGVEDFRSKYRKAGLLAVEDVGRLSDRIAAQEELIGTIDAAVAAENRVILTANAPPEQLSQLDPRLMRRLVGGLSVPLVPPGIEARRELIGRLAELGGFALPAGAIEMLAEALAVTAGELSGALMQLRMLAESEKAPLDGDLVRQYLAQREDAPVPPLQRIAQATAKYFGLRVHDLKGPSRRQGVVTARGVAMHLARMLSRQSLEQIGQYFGGRDHTTVLHACRKTGILVRSQPEIHKAVAELKEQLR